MVSLWCRKASKRTQDLWWKGIPPSIRGKVWKLAIGNDLNVTSGERGNVAPRLERDRLINNVELNNEVNFMWCPVTSPDGISHMGILRVGVVRVQTPQWHTAWRHPTREYRNKVKICEKGLKEVVRNFLIWIYRNTCLDLWASKTFCTPLQTPDMNQFLL